MPVALAEGTVFLPPDHLPFFEPFEKLSFWFPRDIAAFESVRAFAKKLDERKCSAVTRDVDNPARKVSYPLSIKIPHTAYGSPKKDLENAH